MKPDSILDMSVTVGSVQLKNPVLTASGTFGYGLEYAELMDLNRLGGIVVKGLSLEPTQGNPPPRIWETPAGMLNSIGLQNIGVEAFIKDKLPPLRDIDTAVVVNIWGNYEDEYVRVAERLSKETGIDALELNVSCPNKGGQVMCLGQNPELTANLVAKIKEVCDIPLWVKLTPNVTDHVPVALAAQQAGADAVSLINTLLGMAIDIATGQPRLANIVGGLSGPAIKPVAVRMVWQAAKALSIPVVGLGGIMSGDDAAEFMIAGASAVQVGTANFVQPETTVNIIDDLSALCVERGFRSVEELVGTVK